MQALSAVSAVALGCALFVGPIASVSGGDADSRRANFFENRVRPLLANRCYECHGPDAQESGLRVDSLPALLEGGERGPAIIPGNSQASLLFHAVNHSEADLQMPEGEKLAAEEIKILIDWIDDGAYWPGQQIQIQQRAREEDDQPLITEEDRRFWAFQPPGRVALPTVDDPSWCRSPIDYFVLAELERHGLRPAPPADRRTLARRLYYDLLGLPPTPEQIEQFVSDSAPDAYERLIDRLLDSPRYGERWGRHWLDVARYADSNGLDENWAFEFIYRYRDWVVDAFNADMPYDAFVVHQIAGDLLPAEEGEPLEARIERIAAAGFLSVGPKMIADDDPKKKKMDIVDEQLSTIGQTFLGLTIGCARCHDHKFDPIPTADYYAMAGILKSTRTMEHLRVVAPVWLHTIEPPGFDAALEQFQQQREALVAARNAFWIEVAKARYLAEQAEPAQDASEAEPTRNDGAADEASTETAGKSPGFKLPPEEELERWIPAEHQSRWKELQ
ncbi:MAG: DUF1549 domain-containing protein, partial [Planctomycetota bacterium]